MEPLPTKLAFLLSLIGLAYAGYCEPDANSNPTPEDVLVFLGPIHEETILRFKGYTKSADGQMTFKVNAGPWDYTYFVRLGEQVASGKRKTDYRVSKFEEAFEEYLDPTLNAKRRRDVSRLTLVRLDDSAEIVLTIGEAYRDKLMAKLRNRVDDYVFTVSKGDGFKLQDRLYKVVEIKEDAVVVTDSLKRTFNITAPKKTGNEQGEATKP